MILKKIKSPKDVRSLSFKELNILAQEIRNTIIERVSINGGHLASSLGVVELAIALHYVFDSPRDKIIWDVGHQSYPHKLLTGRYDKFDSLRKFQGISGFPVISESEHDAFGTGHSSTSISAALGILESRDLGKLSRPRKVIAVIGDGALTSGLSFEGLNHTGYLKKDLIVILNNNDMSISSNTGALSIYLNKQANGAFYKKEPKNSVNNKKHQVIKEENRRSFSPGELFEGLGFKYIKAFNGHDIELIVKNLEKVKKSNKPTLVHVVTKKGKGYKFSENDPCVYHGINPFNINTGRQKKEKNGKNSFSFSSVLGETLVEIAAKDKRLVAITAAMKEGTGLLKFAEKFPKKFYDVGIAESHAVTFAAGLASQKIKPVVAIYSTFLQRAYDQIIHDVCLQKLPVIFAIDRAGIVGEDGATHQGLFDIPFLRNIPNLTFMSPKDTEELKKMLRFSMNCEGPVAIRYPRGSFDIVKEGDNSEIKTGEAEILSKGKDLTIIAVGTMVQESLKAAKMMLKNKGISAAVINARFINPIDQKTIISFAKKTGKIITVEEGLIGGGFGSSVLEHLVKNDLHNVRVKNLGIGNEFVEHGSADLLRKKYGLNSDGIYKAALNF